MLVLSFEDFKKNMPERCVVGHCSNVRDSAKGISLHKIPFLRMIGQWQSEEEGCGFPLYRGEEHIGMQPSRL